MKRLRTIVVDDEKPARRRLISLLSQCDDVEIVGVGRNGREAVSLIRETHPDLVFLDVQMPRLDGLGVVKEITPDLMPPTIFVTAYEQYALEAFDLHAYGYVLKPFSDERVTAALAHVRKFIPDPDRAGDGASEEGTPPGPPYLERIVIRSTDCVSFLPVDQIDWIDVSGVYVSLHSGGKQYPYRSGLAHLLQRLDPERFIRIHRSAAVNATRVKALRPRSHGDYTLVLHGGQELLLSRAHRLELESWLRQRL